MESLKKGATLCLPGLRLEQPHLGTASSGVHSLDPKTHLCLHFTLKMAERGPPMENGFGKKMAPCSPPYLCSRGCLGSTFSPTSRRRLRVSHALAPSQRSFALVVPSHTSLLASAPSFPGTPPRIWNPSHALHAFVATPILTTQPAKVPAPSRPRPAAPPAPLFV